MRRAAMGSSGPRKGARPRPAFMPDAADTGRGATHTLIHALTP